jgi:Methyltransferase domain
MNDRDAPTWPPPLLGMPEWQMSWGERFALEGLLSQLRPRLAVEIGTAEGGSLMRIAEHCKEVHALDLVRTEAAVPENVELHVGDSREMLPALLADLAEHGRNVDFALVDGDHSADGVRADLRNLLASPAVERTVIVCHDTMNEETRAGIKAAGLADFEKVRLVELDLLTGYMGRLVPFTGQLWGGLGLIVVDADPGSEVPDAPDGDERYFDTHTMIRRLGGRFASDRLGAAPMTTAYGGAPRGILRRLASRLRGRSALQ